MTTPWHVDPHAIRVFAGALFRYAADGTYVQLRAFNHRPGEAPRFITPVRLNGAGTEALVQAATVAAENTAQYEEAAVFCPPVATFHSPLHARTSDVANGLVLAVELDEGDWRAARIRLEGILGPCTLIVHSGGEWVDPATGEVLPRAHFYWRLSEATVLPEEHDALRQARVWAAVLVGGDPTGAPLVHPMRWPGSWNLKVSGAPRMATVAVLNDAAEIHLAEALEALEAAVEAAGMAGAPSSGAMAQHGAPMGVIGGNGQDFPVLASAMAAIPNAGIAVHYNDWVRFGYAVWRATGGADAGLAIWDEWSRKSAKYDEEETARTWGRIGAALRSGGDPPRVIGAGTIFFFAEANGWLRPFPFSSSPSAQAGAPSSESMAQHGATGRNGQDSAPEPWEVAAFPAAPFLASEIVGLAPREWVYGRELVRGYVSVLGAPGGAGKTASSMVVALSVALGIPLLHSGVGAAPLYRLVHGAGGNVWVYNLEDPRIEVLRRVRAAVTHYTIDPIGLEGRLFLDSGRDRPLLLVRRTKDGFATPLIEPLIAELKARGIVLLIIDPFVHSHGLEENNNEQMALVMAAWAYVAAQANCAVWLIHHFRKGAEGGAADSFRGGSAIAGAARAMHTLSGMSEGEAEAFGIDAGERWRFVRHDNAKTNMAPPPGAAIWHRLVSVDLGNGNDRYPDGDSVQVIEAWGTPSPWDGLTWDAIEQILACLSAGPEPGEHWTFSRRSQTRWAGRAIMQATRATEASATAVIAAWQRHGLLREEDIRSGAHRKIQPCVVVDQAVLSEMRRQNRAKS